MAAVLIAASSWMVLGSSAPDALAHIGPSVRENNRYLKLTLFGNRVRLLYTFYVGEVPGAQARQRMDANRNGQLEDAESKGYSETVAQTVGSNLELTVDGAMTPLTWQSVDAGIGIPTVNAGAFSVDMVAWLCVNAELPSHSLALFDHWVPPTPGETELRIEESPGVVVRKATLGSDGTVSQLRARWVGATPMDKLGLHVTFDVDATEADTTAANGCGEVTPATGDSSKPSGGRTWLVFAGIGVLVVALAGIGFARRR